MGRGEGGGKKTKEIASFKNPTCLFFRSFQGTAASFAVQIGVFSITLEPLFPSQGAAFSQAFSVNSFRGRIRDERVGDALAISLGPRDPKRIGRAKKTRQEPLYSGHFGDRKKVTVAERFKTGINVWTVRQKKTFVQRWPLVEVRL